MTLIVLLILAGVSISAVVGNKGIFKKAEQASEVYNRGKAREKLELTLSDAQVIKYTEGLTDEQLTNKINEIGEEIEEREVPDISQAIVDGYIFSVDRTVPKILDYLGKADGVIITARVSNNDTDGWVSVTNSKANITGTIKTYSGGKITETSAKIGSTTIPFSIDADGKYTINNITESGTYTIYAKDNKGKDKTKEINIKVKIDRTAPTVETVTATVDGNKIKLSATGHDKDENREEQSGIKEFSYTITPVGATPETGTFNKNETVEITVTNWVLYTIKVTAIDKCENINETGKETTVDMRDTVGPTFTSVKAEAKGMTIKISAEATDDKSGLQSLSYSVTPTSISPRTGKLTQNKETTLTATQETTYTITFTATDNAGNKTTQSLTAKTVNGLTIVQAKEEFSKGTALKDLIGTKIIDYEPKAGGTWRIFYYDATGYFGAGAKTIFLKRDYDETKIVKLSDYKTYTSAEGMKIMKELNPLWANGATSSNLTCDSSHILSWFCNPSVWKAEYVTEEASYAVGAAPAEMWVRAFNEYHSKYDTSVSTLGTEIVDTWRGYKFSFKGSSSRESS